MIENWIAWVVSLLLSLAGVSCSVKGAVIHVASLNRNFVVTLSCVDIVGICLWTFISTFAVWVYVNLKNICLSKLGYVLFGSISFTFFFFANIFRMFVEILYVVNTANYMSYFLQWQAFEEQVGVGIMFATFGALFLSFHLMCNRQNYRKL